MDTGFRRYDEFIYLRYYIEFFYIENCWKPMAPERVLQVRLAFV